MRKLETILAYDPATEIGYGISTTGQNWLFEGPVVFNAPYRWIQSGSPVTIAEEFLSRVSVEKKKL